MAGATASADQMNLAPPHSIEAEQALLGAVILDNEVLRDVIGIIKSPDQFYRKAHALIYEAMLKLDESGTEIDHISLAHHLESEGLLEEAGGRDRLLDLAEVTPTTAGTTHYASIVRDKAILRTVIATAHRVKAQAQDPTIKPDALIEAFEGEVFKLGAQRFHKASRRIQDILDDFRNQLEFFKKIHASGDDVPGLPSGYPDLDNLSTGFKGGELIILAARPGHGKTSLALNIASNVVTTTHKRRDDGKGGVLFFSLEMRDVELVSRVVCGIATVSLKDIRSGRVSRSDEGRLEDAQAELAGSPLFVDDTFDLTMSEIRAKSRRIKDHYDIEMVVVDYLQLINGDTKLDRHEQIGVVSRGLKGLARELDVPVLALAQLNRSIEGRRGVQQRPMLSDLRESGSIEQDADIVSFIQRDLALDAAKKHEWDQQLSMLAPEEQESARDVEPATLIVAKNRSGPVGDVPLQFRKSCTRFEAAAERYRNQFASSDF